MRKKNAMKYAAEPAVLFSGLVLKDIAEIEIQPVHGSVWAFMRRRDGSIVRVWVSRPDAERSLEPLKVTVEAE